MKIKVSEATNIQLNWLVGTLSQGWSEEDALLWVQDDEEYQFNPTTDWAQGGPIIEREKISLQRLFFADGGYFAMWWPVDAHDQHDRMIHIEGETPLIAAMRCYVASNLGDEVEIPEELK
jgi:hypothetical protein